MRPTEPLLAAPGWAGATQHPFLAAVRDGSVPPDVFDTWLVQDALFVADLLAFQARLVARAPRTAQGVLARGVVALDEELTWFAGQAAARGPAPAQPGAATTAYRGLLQRLDAAPYPVAVTALWVLERVYLLAWQHTAPAAEAYRAFVEHWTDPGFAAYVEALQALADDAGAPGDAVAEVLALEAAFWPQP